MITSRSWRAWSSTVRLSIDARSMNQVTADLQDLLDQVDRAVSRFRSDSELTRANQSAGRPMVISRLFTDLLESRDRRSRREAAQRAVRVPGPGRDRW
jgi:FAD:protein FMN transferase